MKVLVVGNMYPPHALGGYERSCADVMTRMEANGHEVHVLTTTFRRADVDPSPEPRVRRELEWYWDDHRLTRPSGRRRLQIERANQRALRATLRSVRPDVVSVWNMGAMSTSLVTSLAASGVPVVWAVCDDWLDYAPRIDPWMSAWAHRPRALGRVAQVLTRVPTRLPDDLGACGGWCFVSAYTWRWAQERTPWSFRRATVVFSGVDGRDFPPVDPASVQDRAWGWRLLCVGRVEPRKGFDTALRALALLPGDARLDLLGPADTESLAELHRLAEELGVRDRLHVSQVPRDRLAEAYRCADAVIFPSRWEEPFGLVPVESMTCATPVVATVTGGAGEFLRPGENCLAFAPDDHAGLASALRRLADDADLRRRLVHAGAATAAALTVDALAERMEQCHRIACEGFVAPWPPPRSL